ncbi:MAG: DUF333 domain-containing protein [Candidatus Altiarchaeia archaeon]
MQKSNPLAALIIAIAVIAPLGALFLMNQPVESKIKSFEECTNAGYTILESDPRKCITPEGKGYNEIEKTCATDAACGNGSYCRKGVCKIFSPGTDCSIDADCTLINRRNLLSCCREGRCDALDYSLPEWAAVSAGWFTAEKAAGCTADCGPAPMCPAQNVNANYSAKCVNATCRKYSLDEGCTDLCGDGKCDSALCGKAANCTCTETHDTCPADCTEGPNNASVNCIKKGGKTITRRDTNGNEYTACVFSSGTECEEWKFYRGECSAEADRIDQSCETAADCAIKSMRGECGPYPLCVNKDYVPKPTGNDKNASGACGYADIDGCLCENGICVGTIRGEPNVN